MNTGDERVVIGAGSEDEVGSGADEGVEGRSKKEEEVVEEMEEEEEEEEEVVVVVRSGVVEVVVVESEVVEVEVVVVVDVVVNVVVVVVVVDDDDDDDRDVVEVIDSEEVKIESVGEEVENGVAEEVDMDEEEKEGGIVGKVEDISGVDKDISSVDEDVSGVDEDVLGVEEDVSGVDKDVSGVDEDIVIVRNNHATYQHRLPLSAMIIVPRPDPDPVPPCFHVDNGDVVSYDETLNVHADALYRFLLTQASQCPPGYRVHCQGTHTETRHRLATSSNNSTRTESYTESVTDFDFYILITPPHNSSPSVHSKAPTYPQDTDHFHWSVADNEPVYRGKMVRQVESPSPISLPEDGLPLLAPGHFSAILSRKASRRERKDYREWILQRTRKGIPPWTFVPGLANGQWSQAAIAMAAHPTTKLVSSDPPLATSNSSKTLRYWTDSYCSSPKLLKEFVYTKLLYGWDLTQLESAIRSTIALAPYHGDIHVSFTPVNSKIYIRSSNRLSRFLSNRWLKLISILLFIYPFIWLFKRFHPKGGGKWEVCGSAYALKRWIPWNQDSDLPSYQDTITGSSMLSPALTTATSISSIPSTTTSSPHHPHSVPLSQTRVVQTPSGPYKLIGQREGEWFRYWEPILLRAVTTRHQSTVPLAPHTELHGQRATPGSALDGYHDSPDGIQVGSYSGSC